jgi:HEXXH motif-containing protein
VAIHFDFQPDPARARALDRRMYAELGRSLRHVSEQCRGRYPFDAPAMDALCSALESGVRYPATTFARYYDLVVALLGDDLAAAAGHHARLADEQPLADGVHAGPLDESERSECYRLRMGADMGPNLTVNLPTAGVGAAFMERFGEGMTLLRQGAPSLAAEVEAIVHEVVGVAGGPDDVGEFHGGSHFQLWGALFLNAALHETRIAMAEVIAHESAHSLLFSFCTEEALVLNDDAEIYPSPLRADLRPMDGIYHATFVSARMHWVMQQLLESGLLTGEEIREAKQAAAADRENFEAGYRVVAEHGRLTRHGHLLMQGARDYMDAAYA